MKRETILAEGRSSFPAQGAKASTRGDRADFAAPSVTVERPAIEEAAAPPLAAASSPPRDDDEALDSARPVRTLAERMADETEEELARRERAAAEAVRADLVAWGAIHVKLEERVRATTRARAPEVAEARTLPEQLDAFWASRRIEVSPPRRTRVLDLLATLETETA